MRGSRRLIAPIRQEVHRVRRDPHVGQERLQVHFVGGQGNQYRSHIRKLFDAIALGIGQNGETDRRRLAPLIAP
jgi:hypothetical protein